MTKRANSNILASSEITSPSEKDGSLTKTKLSSRVFLTGSRTEEEFLRLTQARQSK